MRNRAPTVQWNWRKTKAQEFKEWYNSYIASRYETEKEREKKEEKNVNITFVSTRIHLEFLLEQSDNMLLSCKQEESLNHVSTVADLDQRVQLELQSYLLPFYLPLFSHFFLFFSALLLLVFVNDEISWSNDVFSLLVVSAGGSIDRKRMRKSHLLSWE